MDAYIVLDVQIRSQFPKILDQSQIIILDYKPLQKKFKWGFNRGCKVIMKLQNKLQSPRGMFKTK